jgi:SAM-dependent methyltransferase
MLKLGVSGFAPSVEIKPYNPELRKYVRAWDEIPAYRVVSPGETLATRFLHQAQPPKDADAIDFGCGTGRGGLMLALMGGMRVTLVDFAGNCLDPEVVEICKTQPDRLKFMQHDLTQLLPINAAYGYCCDVMEHIPEADVQKVLINVLHSARHCFFSIGTEPDNLGAEIGEVLHVTVKPAAWWKEQLAKAGAVIHWQEMHEGGVSFYCSAWRDAKDVLVAGIVNVPLDVLEAQTAANIRAEYRQVLPHRKQDREVIVLCGGPSMPAHLDEIKKLRAEGAALVTVNGAYRWAIEQGLEPSAQIVLDAREFNARFVEPVTPYTQYMIASQAHPATYAGLPWDRTLQWHCAISDENAELVREVHGCYYPVMGGSTVTLRAIPLLRMLGYWRMHLFGFDSCMVGEQHHAYAQAENDGERTVPVVCGGKTFVCAPWHLSQASEFQDILGILGNEVELAVYGDGLIAAMMQSGADFSQKEQ